MSRSRALLAIAHTLQDGARFVADVTPLMGIVAPPGELGNASAAEHRSKGVLVDKIPTNPHVGVHLRRDSTVIDGAAVVTAGARKRAHDTRPRQTSFRKRNLKAVALAI